MNVIKTIVVCGAGTMGSGIAQIAAQNGFATILFDLNDAVLAKAKTSIEKSLQQLVAKEKITELVMQQTINNLQYTNIIEHCIADVIIEAIIEQKDAKVNLFNKLATLNSSSTIFASNTSSISIQAIANQIEYNDRVVGLHFFNPATIMKLVEIIKTNNTSNIVVQQMQQLCTQLNKTAVVCKDSPGFIVNRVARHYYLEAMQMVEKNEATIETVDAALEAAGFKMGAFKLMDLIGLDINYSVSNIVWNDLGKPERLTPSNLQKQKVEDGQLGKKTGKGFYNYT